MSVLFRCRADAKTGMGHLVRCRVLARALKARGQNCTMIGPAQNFRTAEDEALFDKWQTRIEWESAEIEANYHAVAAKNIGAKHIILDDYRSDGAHQLRLRNAGYVLLQQYNASVPQAFAANFVINSSPAERRETYATNFQHSDISTLMGPYYAILRPAFSKMSRPVFSPTVKRILVTFGGGDDRGAFARTLDILAPALPKDCQLVFMVGASNPNIDKLRQSARGTSTEIAVNHPDIPALIASCDLAILSGGTTTFEAAYMGLPMILCPIVPNQHAQAQGWADRGAALNLGPMEDVSDSDLRTACLGLMGATDRRRAMHRAGQACVDGAGVDRILDAFLGDLS